MQKVDKLCYGHAVIMFVCLLRVQHVSRGKTWFHCGHVIETGELLPDKVFPDKSDPPMFITVRRSPPRFCGIPCNPPGNRKSEHEHCSIPATESDAAQLMDQDVAGLEYICMLLWPGGGLHIPGDGAAAV